MKSLYKKLKKVLHKKNNNLKIKFYNKNKVINKLFKLCIKIYKIYKINYKML
jgi:hypothetical protein